MRKRQIKKNFFVNEKEERILKQKAAKAKVSEAEFLRSLITDREVKEKPGIEFYDYIKVLRGMGINVNQLTMLAHKNGEINVSRYEELKKEIEDFILEVKEHFLNIDKNK